MSTAIATSNSLADLAARISAEHDAVGAAMKRGVQHGIAAGHLLNEAKALVEHGEWLPWLRDHCQIPESTARLYMRLARHESEIANVNDLTVRQAIAQLTEPDDEYEANLREGQRLADNVRAADRNYVNVFVEKCRELRGFAEMFDEYSEEDQDDVDGDEVPDTAEAAA